MVEMMLASWDPDVVQGRSGGGGLFIAWLIILLFGALLAGRLPFMIGLILFVLIEAAKKLKSWVLYWRNYRRENLGGDLCLLGAVAFALTFFYLLHRFFTWWV